MPQTELPYAPAPIQIITVRPHSGVTVVCVCGEVDMSNVDQLSAALHGAVAAGATRLMVDMTAVRFMSCAGLNCLVVGGMELGACGGQLSVVAQRNCVGRVIETLGFSEFLKLSIVPPRHRAEGVDRSPTA